MQPVRSSAVPSRFGDNGMKPPTSSTRRTFLKQTAIAATVAIASGSSTRAQDDPSTGFIDAHSHIWTPEIDKYPLATGQSRADLKPLSFTPEELLAVARPAGVRRVVLIQHNIYHGTDNRYLTDTMARYPGLFSAVACINAAAAEPEREMDRLFSLGVRGLRIRPGDGGQDRWSDCAGMKRMWRHGAETGIALCPLINPEYLTEVDTMCQAFPRTTVVIDHFARIGIDGEIRAGDVRKLTRLSRFPQTHVKVSAYYALGKKRPPHDELIPMIKRLYEDFGPQRLMWASDCPYQLAPPNTYEDSIALIRDRIDFLSDEDKAWLLRKTAERVFFQGITA